MRASFWFWLLAHLLGLVGAAEHQCLWGVAQPGVPQLMLLLYMFLESSGPRLQPGHLISSEAILTEQEVVESQDRKSVV